MAYFAQLDNNKTVIRVVSVNNYDCLKDSIKNYHPEITQSTLKGISGDENIVVDGKSVTWEDKDKGKQYLKSLYGSNTNWLKTSFNRTERMNFAGVGYKYITSKDIFVPPKQYPSWVLNNDGYYEAPVPNPNDGWLYTWDEANLQWVNTNNRVPFYEG